MGCSSSRAADQRILKACQKGDTKKVRALIEGGASLETSDTSGRTLLHYAVQFQHLDIVSLLLESGANVNAVSSTSRTALFCACTKDNVEAAALLHGKGADLQVKDSNGFAPLHFAASWGATGVLKFLLEKGVKASSKDEAGKLAGDYFHDSVPEEKRQEIQKILQQAKHDDQGSDEESTAQIGIRFSLNRDSMSEVSEDEESLMDGSNAPDLDDSNERRRQGALVLAAVLTGNLQRAEELVRTGKVDLGCADISGVTPLHIAAREGHLEFARLLIEKGAPVDQKTLRGETPLYLACGKNNPKKAGKEEGKDEGGEEAARQRLMVSLFLEAEADPTAVTGARSTPLHSAASQGDPFLCRILLKALGDGISREEEGEGEKVSGDGDLKLWALEANTEEGKTPFLEACGAGHLDCAEVLLTEYQALVDSPDDMTRTIDQAKERLNSIVSKENMVKINLLLDKFQNDPEVDEEATAAKNSIENPEKPENEEDPQPIDIQKDCSDDESASDILDIPEGDEEGIANQNSTENPENIENEELHKSLDNQKGGSGVERSSDVIESPEPLAETIDDGQSSIDKQRFAEDQEANTPVSKDSSSQRDEDEFSQKNSVNTNTSVDEGMNEPGEVGLQSADGPVDAITTKKETIPRSEGSKICKGESICDEGDGAMPVEKEPVSEDSEKSIGDQNENTDGDEIEEKSKKSALQEAHSLDSDATQEEKTEEDSVEFSAKDGQPDDGAQQATEQSKNSIEECKCMPEDRIEPNRASGQQNEGDSKYILNKTVLSDSRPKLFVGNDGSLTLRSNGLIEGKSVIPKADEAVEVNQLHIAENAAGQINLTGSKKTEAIIDEPESTNIHEEVREDVLSEDQVEVRNKLLNFTSDFPSDNSSNAKTALATENLTNQPKIESPSPSSISSMSPKTPKREFIGQVDNFKLFCTVFEQHDGHVDSNLHSMLQKK